jgi:hypothetical protein
MTYRHMKSLDGLRHSRVDFPNKGWRNASFHGFSDYLQTSAFKGALEKLFDLAAHKPTAIMCAEAVPWRCDRSLTGDALLIRVIRVLDIYSPTNLKPQLSPQWPKSTEGKSPIRMPLKGREKEDGRPNELQAADPLLFLFS